MDEPRRARRIGADLVEGRLAPLAALEACAELSRDPAASPADLADLSAVIASAEALIGAERARRGFGDALVAGQAKHRRGSGGAVATSNPLATDVALGILVGGGNAIDAACATALALAVTDPANAGIAGRCHAVIRRDGKAIALDGATQAPAALRRDPQRAAGAVPVPGLLPALGLATRMASRPWAELCGPAIALAEEGFIVPSGLAFAWAAQRDRLAAHPHAVRHFLKPDGTAYRAGERFRQPALARLLRRVAAAGPRALHEEEIARDIAVQIEEEGGPLRESDLRGYRAVEGSLVWGRYKDWTIAAPGAQAWGHTLVEMLQIADRFEFAGDAWSAPEAEALALVMLVALDDRPQEIGTLKAKPHGLPLDLLADAEFAAKRANEISAMVDGHGTARENALRRLLARLPPAEDRDTTHFSIVDAEGTAVSLTCSLGPHFGSATASARHGFLFAHSYRMLSDPSPGARDATEMCPAMLTSAGPTGTGARSIALGAAGSERIPGAIALTAVNLVEHRRPEGEAVAAPRLTWKGGKLRAHCDLTPAILDHLRRRGFPLEPSGRGYSNHLGIVHLAGEDGAGRHTAAADPAFDGTAAVVS